MNVCMCTDLPALLILISFLPVQRTGRRSFILQRNNNASDTPEKATLVKGF